MKGEGKRAWQAVNRARQAVPLLLIALTGCTGHPYVGPPPRPTPRPPAQTASANTPLASARSDSNPNGPASDPLIGDTRQPIPDPLMGDTKPAQSDPLIGADPLPGPGMPTDHSHWLRGRLRGARVTMLLNGIRYGSFSGSPDQDITMNLRQGANTVTFLYQPQGPGSSADLEIVEGEHHPPLAPLATFRSAPTPAGGGDTPDGGEMKTETKTSFFMAN